MPAALSQEDRIGVLYGQDGAGNYGNVLIVDFEGKAVIPDLNCTITR